MRINYGAVYVFHRSFLFMMRAYCLAECGASGLVEAAAAPPGLHAHNLLHLMLSVRIPIFLLYNIPGRTFCVHLPVTVHAIYDDDADDV